MTTMTIELTNDLDLKNKLKNKLEEYKTRYMEEENLETFTKLRVLENLLLYKSINKDEQFQDVFNHLPPTYAYRAPEQIYPYFENAWHVIDDYNITGGENLQGGTGL